MAAGKADEAARPGGQGGRRRAPLYARLLRLRRLRPGPVLCFIFLEGSIAFGVLLALANLTSWWTVLALPVAVAVMVKLNDVVAAATAKPPQRPPTSSAKPAEAEKAAEKPDWPLRGNPSKPLIEEDKEEEDKEEEDKEEEDTAEEDTEEEDTEEEDTEEEDTEKTESPTATRSSSA
jgi:hypothetical protein